MTKKARAPAPKTAKSRKREAAPRKSGPGTAGSGKTISGKTLTGKTPSASRSSATSGESKLLIRKLKAELALAHARIEALQASADTDFLLDIPNRRGFERELHRSIAYIKRYRATGALIVVDVDRLKPINDTFGHAAGDQVLKAVVAVILHHVRSSDVVGRLGGDEFAVLLWNLTDTDARAKAASLEDAIDNLTFTFDGRIVTAGASAGVATLGPHAEAGKALEEADRAMYVRKAQRRHETKAFSSEVETGSGEENASKNQSVFE